jgi:hypothetical protein
MVTTPGELAHHVYVGTEYFGIYKGRVYSGNQFLEDLLKRDDGSVMSMQEAASMHPHYTLMLAAINSRVRDLLHQRTNHGKRHRVFISYRWESDELKRWVAILVERLRAADFEVFVDQDSTFEVGDLTGPAMLMANMALSDIVLMVLSENYAKTTPVAGLNSIGFVWDEQVLATRLRNEGVLRIVGLLKEKNGRPDICLAENTIDIRGMAQPWEHILTQLQSLAAKYAADA